MIDEKVIRNGLKKAIDKGASRFAIFPFGVNGVRVKNCLKDCFGIEADFIADNEYCKYNENIIDIRELQKAYTEDMHILLTAEDESLNNELKDELLQFAADDRIVNFASTRGNKERLYEVGQRLSLQGILPVTGEEKALWMERNKSAQGKIKVRVLHSCECITWNSMKTICEAFKKDKKYDVLIILGDGDWVRKRKQMEREGFDCVLYREYAGEIDKPDIVVMSQASDTFPYDFRRHAKMVVAASMTLIRYAHSTDEFWKQCIEPSFAVNNPDYYLFDSMMYSELKSSGYFKGKIVEMGNAKYDGIYHACRKKTYNEGWEKLKGKKVLLWATDHGVYGEWMTKDVTFDIYARSIFEYADRNRGMGFILRPHQRFINEMVRMGYWSEGELEMLKEYCAKSSNVAYDDSDSYDNAFSVSDAVIVDAYCGITCTALPTLKPVCLLYRSEECVPYHPELAESYYSAHNVPELLSYFDMIKRGEDGMIELRREASRKFVKNFDGKNGERIKQFIEGKYFSLNQDIDKEREI